MEQKTPIGAEGHHGKGGTFAMPGLDRAKFRRPSETARWAFWAACVVGVITHIYIFTNLILNHDSVWRAVYDNDNLALGRWSLQFLSELSTQFQLPVVAAVISIFMLALTAGLTVSVLEISSKPVAVLAAAFLVTAPSVACIFTYMFTADAYFICLFLNALAVYLAKNYRRGWLPAVLLCAVACGGYQAFLCYAIGLFLMDCILELLTRDTPTAQVIRKGVKYILVVLAALVLYYLVLLVLLKVTGTTLSSYQGLDSITSLSPGKLLAQIPAAYKNFVRYFTSASFRGGLAQAALDVFLLLGLGALIYLAVVRRVYRQPLRLALVAAGLLLLPLALNFITVLSMGADVHALMIYAFVLLPVLALVLVERAAVALGERGAHRWRVLPLCGVILAGVLVWNDFCVCNVAYLRLQVCYENSFALANRIAARIETVEGYSPDMPVALVGEASRSLYGGTIGEFTPFNSLTGTGDRLLYSPEPHVRTRKFIEHYIGLHMPAPSAAQKAALSESEFVKALPCYPQEGSVAVYEGVIVVKLSEGAVR